MSQTLIEIGNAFSQIAAMLDDCPDGELSPELEAMVDRWLAELGPAAEAKLDSYVAVIRTHQLRAVARKAEADRLAKLIAADEGVARRLQDRLKWFLETTKRKKVETERYRISLRANGGKLPLEIQEGATLPAEFTIIETRPNKERIRDALTAGERIDGCQLLDRGTHLRIE